MGIRDFFKISHEHLFDRAINLARRQFAKSMYKGWGATYVDGIMIRVDKTDNKLEQAIITCCNELSNQIYDEVKDVEDIKEIFIGDTRVSWHFKDIHGGYGGDDDTIIEADISEYVEDV